MSHRNTMSCCLQSQTRFPIFNPLQYCKSSISNIVGVAYNIKHNTDDLSSGCHSRDNEDFPPSGT